MDLITLPLVEDTIPSEGTHPTLMDTTGDLVLLPFLHVANPLPTDPPPLSAPLKTLHSLSNAKNHPNQDSRRLQRLEMPRKQSALDPHQTHSPAPDHPLLVEMSEMEMMKREEIPVATTMIPRNTLLKVLHKDTILGTPLPTATLETTVIHVIHATLAIPAITGIHETLELQTTREIRSDTIPLSSRTKAEVMTAEEMITEEMEEETENPNMEGETTEGTTTEEEITKREVATPLPPTAMTTAMDHRNQENMATATLFTITDGSQLGVVQHKKTRIFLTTREFKFDNLR